MDAAEFEQAKGLYQLMVLAAWADGELAQAELLVEGALIAASPELRALPGKGVLAQEAKALLDQLGLAAALTQVAALLRDQAHREAAFAACARVLEADGTIARAEFLALTRLRELFGLSDATTARLLRQAAK